RAAQGRQDRHDPARTTHGDSLDLAIGEGLDGPIFCRADGHRLDRHGASRIAPYRQTCRYRQADQPTHAAARVRHRGLDAGGPPGDVQEAASHADPRTTMRHVRSRASLDRHAIYVVATYLAGAAR